MQDWEKAVQKFLKKWQKRNVTGALVCGSYVTGSPSRHSDIDIHIILDKKTKWRERGNEIVDGFLIEYFANPIRKHYEYLEEDYKQRKRINAHMFTTGKIIFDKTGELKKLVNDSKKYMKKRFPGQNKVQTELAKYHIWDMLDNLEEIYERDAMEFEFVYQVHLQKLFDAYSEFLQFESIDAHKIRRFLSFEKDKLKYNVEDFPDEKFVSMLVKAMELKQRPKMMTEYKKLTERVLDKMGGFNIDGWRIKSKA